MRNEKVNWCVLDERDNGAKISLPAILLAMNNFAIYMAWCFNCITRERRRRERGEQRHRYADRATLIRRQRRPIRKKTALR